MERNDFISEEKIHIQFESNTLRSIDETTTLEYDVTNTSRNYDANVSVTCSAGENEYIIFNYEPHEMKVEAGETKSGTLTASMLKAVEEDKEIEVECELVATPAERESLGDEYIEPFSRSGVLMKVPYSDEDQKHWVYKSNITKVVFEDKMVEHDTTEELIFDVSKKK